MLKKWLYFVLLLALLTVPQPGVWGVALVYADPPPPPAPPPSPPPPPRK